MVTSATKSEKSAQLYQPRSKIQSKARDLVDKIERHQYVRF